MMCSPFLSGRVFRAYYAFLWPDPNCTACGAVEPAVAYCYTCSTWADADSIGKAADALVYKDANGVTLAAGDTVVITKDLDVKGTGFTAKRGTAVRNIGLVAGDSEHIEGRVNGVKIHILTKFLKKS